MTTTKKMAGTITNNNTTKTAGTIQKNNNQSTMISQVDAVGDGEARVRKMRGEEDNRGGGWET